MKTKEMLNKVKVSKSYNPYLVNLVADVEYNKNYGKIGEMVFIRFVKRGENNKQKSHENLGIFSKTKKFVAFFQANSWLENSDKMLKI